MNLLAGLLIALLAITGNVDDVSRSVAIVETFDGRGTGFLVDDTTVVTAAHVTPEGSVNVRFGEIEISGTVVASDEVNDLALIELDEQPDLEPLKVSSSPPEMGEDVFAIGAPTDGGLTVTRGIVSAVFDDGTIQTDASVNPGNSGGPLVRPNGEVLGVVIMKANAEGIGYATGVEDLRAILSAPLQDHTNDGTAEPAPEAGDSPPEPPPERSEPPDSSSSGLLVVMFGLTTGIVVLAVAFVTLRIRSKRLRDDFEVRLGPVHNRFGG